MFYDFGIFHGPCNEVGSFRFVHYSFYPVYTARLCNSLFISGVILDGQLSKGYPLVTSSSSSCFFILFIFLIFLFFKLFFVSHLQKILNGPTYQWDSALNLPICIN